MVWNDKQTELLKTLLKERMTATRMALEISLHGDKVTRNAVMGKLNRLGLCQSQTGDYVKKRTQRECSRDNTLKIKIRRKATMENAPPPKRAPTIPEEPPRRQSFRGLALLDLEHFDCRFPRGGPGSFTFCGSPRDTESDPSCPYCKFHKGVAYNSAALRSIRPAA